MTKDDIYDLKKLLSTPKNIVIVPHKNPDGDAMGSTLGLFHYLKKLQQHVVVITPNDYPNFLKWLPSEDKVLKYDTDTEKAISMIENAELIFTLDFNALNRIGHMEIQGKY